MKITRDLLEHFLSYFPRLYISILQQKTNVNIEKTIYLSSISRGDYVIEGGANIGYYSRLFAYQIGRQGLLVCFEPVAENFLQLKANLKSAPFNNVVVVKKARNHSAPPFRGGCTSQ